MIGPQFQHGVVVIRLHRQHAQGDAQVVVEIAWAGRSRSRDCNTVWIICRVVVLPTLPVTATTAPVNCRRLQAAHRSRA